MSHTITFELTRADMLTANDRPHYQQRATITRNLRNRAAIQAPAAHIPARDRAHVTVTVHWPDHRRRDVLNLAPTVKALIDGMTDAGCWPDDDDRHLIGPDFRVAPTPSGRPGITRLVVEVRPAEEG